MTIRIKRLSANVDLALKMATAFLMTFAVAFVLVQAQLYFDASLITQQHHVAVLAPNDQH